MVKLAVAVLAVALAGTAGAAGWRSLRLDGSSEASFAESVSAFGEKLTLTQRYAFAWALQDIWVKGVKDAEAEQSEYAPCDFFRQVDGLSYKEVVTLLDPTGDTLQARLRDAYALGADDVVNRQVWNESPWPPGQVSTGRNGEQERGR